MKSIINKNDKGLLHGYQEWYYTNGKLWVKCFYNNGIRIGYREEHHPFNHNPFNHKLEKSFYI